MEAKDKRVRSSNFTSEENELLISLIEKYAEIINNKRTDGASWRQKDEAWTKLAAEFNSASGFAPRSVKVLKSKFENHKRQIKRKVSEEKCEMFRTGGGINPTKKLPAGSIEERLRSLLSISVSGLSNQTDSDNDAVQVAPEVIMVPPLGNAEFPSTQATTSSTEMWREWSPSLLRTPISAPLFVPETQEVEGDDDDVTDMDEDNLERPQDEGNVQLNEERISPPNTPAWRSRRQSILKKRAAEDSIDSFNKLTKLKLQLTEFQLQCVKMDLEEKKEFREHQRQLRELAIEQKILEKKIKEVELEEKVISLQIIKKKL